ncbi:hypothetical protein EB093_08585 [bacterium]|nr:hypothetical protein [bacterium]
MWRAVSVGVMTVGVAVMGGCGFNSRESTTYTVPNWTGNGRIIAGKEYMRSHSNLISNSVLDEARSSIVVMDADGGNEHELFEAGYSSLIAMSASGNVVAYISGRLHVMVNDGGWKEKWSVDINEGGARNYDTIQISPDETKIYVSEGTYQFKVFAIDGRLLTHQVRNCGGGVFYSNDQIINWDFENKSTTKFSINDSSFTLLPGLIGVDAYSASQNIIFHLSARYIQKQDLGNLEITTTNFSYAPYSNSDFTTKVVMSYAGSIDPAGIVILDINRSEITRIR